MDDLVTWAIRERRDGDVQESAGVLSQVHFEDRYPIHWPDDPCAWLAPPNMVIAWVAARHDEVLGHVCLVRRDLLTHDLRLERLFVSPQAKGMGLGRALLGHANAWAAHRRSRLTLDVAENCSSAIALYGRLGWRLTGRTPIDWGEDVAEYLLHFEAPPP